MPPNLKFYVDDVEGDWGYREDEAFDVIHGRGMVGAIADWPLLFRQIRTNLKPGGLVEMQEYEGWLFSNKDISKTDTSKWQNLINEASSKFGKELDMARKLKPLMEGAGFVDVREQIVKVRDFTPLLFYLSHTDGDHRFPSVRGLRVAAIRRWVLSSASTSATLWTRTPLRCLREYLAGHFKSAR